MELSDFMKRRILFEVDNIKSHILARSCFNNSPVIIWTVYRCTLSSKEFSDYCLELVKLLKNRDKYEVYKVNAKEPDILVLKVKYA